MNTTSNDQEEAEEFRNEQLRVVVRKHSGCRVEMEIVISPKATTAAYKYAIKSINKGVSIPGFRKGKAPEAVIARNYSKYVSQEWQEVLVKTACQEAMALTNLYPMAKETFKKPQVKKTSKDEGAEVVLEFETAPKIPEIDPKQLILKEVSRNAVTDKEIADYIENLRLHYAKWEEVSDRPVQEGDYIDLAIEDVNNPGHFFCKNMRFTVAKEEMEPWIYSLVLGKHVNDTVEGTSERSKNSDPKKEFIPTQCKLTINAIKTAQLPDVDEEFAKKVGVNSVEELRENATTKLNQQADEEVKEELGEQINAIFLEQYPVDLPFSLVQSEVKNRISMVKRDMEQSGQSQEEIAEHAAELENTIRKDVQDNFSLYFIAVSLAEKYQITVTEKELLNETFKQLYRQGSASQPSEPEDLRRQAHFNVLFQKVKEYLIGQATITA